MFSATDLFTTEIPDHCTPTTPVLVQVSSYFGVCIPTPQAAASTILGCLSIISWLGAQMPQIFKNYKLKSTAGLSLFFLAEWLLGDATNFAGAILTHQATWQVIIATYYVIVDVCLVCQYFWYSYLRTTYADGSVHSADGYDDDDAASDMINSLSPINSNFGDGEQPQAQKDNSEPETNQSVPSKPIATPRFTAVNYEKSRHDSPDGAPNHNGSWFVQASPRTVTLAATASRLVTQAAAAPTGTSALAYGIHMTTATNHTTAEYIGTIVSWCSTFLYLGSRLPQIYKNWRRQSTAGLSPLLFFAAFCGNLFYTTSLLANPNGWSDAGPYGNHGWTGPEGSKRGPWIANTAPFFLGAAGCLGLDITIGIQFLLYEEGQDKLVRVRDRYGHSRWERVSGWMRGWIPTVAREKVVDMAESQRLLTESRELERHSHHSGYGAFE